MVPAQALASLALWVGRCLFRQPHWQPQWHCVARRRRRVGSMNLEARAKAQSRNRAGAPGSRARLGAVLSRLYTSLARPERAQPRRAGSRQHPPQNRALPRLDAAARCPERPERQADPQDAVDDGYDRRRLPKRAHKAVKRHEQHHA